MSQDLVISLSIASRVPIEERHALVDTLKNEFDIRDSQQRHFGPEWEPFLIFVKDAGVIAGTVASLIKLANEINVWRENARKRGITPDVRLQRPKQPSLDLATATDEEVREWLLREQSE